MKFTKMMILRKSFFGFFLVFFVVSFQNCSEFKPSELSNSSVVTLQFNLAKDVINRQCIGCHAQGTAQSLVYQTEQEYVVAGLIVPQQPDLSKLINRLKNYSGTATSARNMPPVGILSDMDYQTLVTWVEGLVQEPSSCAPQENLLEPQIRRLTRNQYRNSVQAAFGLTFTTSQMPVINDGNPRIGLAGDPERLNVTDVNVNAFYDSAVSIVGNVRTAVTDIANCVNAANDSCYSTILSTYGQRLWRRPLTSAETTDLQSGLTQLASATRIQKMEYLLISLILSPNHLFRTELGAGTGQPTGVFQLSQYEIASLLSFSMWDAPPDSTLMNLAQSSQLGNVTALRAQVSRMSADSRFRGSLSNFIIELLKIDDVRTIDKDSTYSLTSNEREQLFLSAQQTIESTYSSPTANFFAPFHSRQFHANQAISRFMNLTSGSLNSTLTPVNMSTSQRYGIMSHPAFLTAMSGRTASGIVKRGTFTLEQLLCYHLEPAPADISENVDLPPNFDRNLVTSRVELTVTHSSQTRCIGCHAVIDPTGFAFENFNAIGQFRLTEKAANITIDSSGRISGATRREIAFNNSVDFMEEMASNEDFQACVQKHFFKYISGQNAQGGAGRCEYENFERNINSKNRNIQSMLESAVELESFIRRRRQ